MRIREFVMLGCGALALVQAAEAAGPVVHDQSNLALDNSVQIGTQLRAADFVLASGTRLTSATVWLADDVVNDNGVLDSFSGQLGYAFFLDDAGHPGSFLQAGKAIAVSQRDTGLQDSFGDDIVEVTFDFQNPVLLASGTRWFALHEGSWLSAADGSETWWEVASSVVGAFSHFDDGETNAGPWTEGATEPAFVLFGTPADWDQGALDLPTGEGTTITSLVTANDFNFASAASFSTVDAWLADSVINNNDVLDSFSGAISWAIYANGANKPGTEIAHGNGANVRLVETDLNADSGTTDLKRVRFGLGRSVALDPGTFWLALHEGSWTSASDGTTVYWLDSSQSLGFGQYTDDNETAPGAFGFSNGFNSAFALFDEVLFASGFESGAICAWTSAAGAVCP